MRSMVCNKNIMRVVILNVNIFFIFVALFYFHPRCGRRRGDPAPGGRYKRPSAGPASQSESVSRHPSIGLVIMLASSGLIK